MNTSDERRDIMEVCTECLGLYKFRPGRKRAEITIWGMLTFTDKRERERERKKERYSEDDKTDIHSALVN